VLQFKKKYYFYKKKMNKNIIAVVILVIFGITIFSNKKMIEAAIIKKYGALRAAKFLKVYAAIKNLPLSKKQITFLMSQILVETGFFSSRVKVFDLNNNASGIYYSGSAAQIANGATKGTPRPEKEGGFYAKFDSLTDWAKEYLRVLNKGSYPLNSNSIEEFTTKLKQNNYFTDTLENYLKNIIFFYNFLIKNKF